MGGFLMLLARPWVYYARFSGRSRRIEFWLFLVIRWAVLFALFVDAPTDPITGRLDADDMSGILIGFVLLWLFGTMIPAWAVTVRRLHDADLSGKWLAACFIPYLGFLATVVIGLLPGSRGENDKGFDPRFPEFDDSLEETFS